MWHYGPVRNWTTNTFYVVNALFGTDITLRTYVMYRWTTDYIVKAVIQMSAGNITNGDLYVCNIQYITNTLRNVGTYGTFPCPYSDTITYTVVMPNGVAYLNGRIGMYGFTQLTFVELCTATGK